MVSMRTAKKTHLFIIISYLEMIAIEIDHKRKEDEKAFLHTQNKHTQKEIVDPD